MNKIKKIVYAGTALALTAPVAAMAQFVPPTETDTGLQSTSITQIIITAMKWMLGLIGFLAIIAFVIAGILYLTAAGNEDQAGKAKKAMLYAILGIVVALIGLIIITAVQAWLASESFNF